MQKQNTEHALMTAADTDRSLQLVLEQGQRGSYLDSSKAAGRVWSDQSYNILLCSRQAAQQS